MGEKPTEDKSEPTLELPSLRLPGLGRRRRPPARPAERPPTDAEAPDTGGRRRSGTRPRPPALTAVVASGILVGLAGTAATYGALWACETARGTPSCGKPGFVVLVVTVLALVLLGAVLLRLLGVSEPWGVSGLGVGLLCVVVLIASPERLTAWAFAVVPVLTALGFVAGRWLTTRFVEPPDEGPAYDVR